MRQSALCIRWPKYWSFSFSICPSSKYSGLISFRIDCFDLCNPRDSQESSPISQFKSMNSSQLSLLYGPTLTSPHMTTGKTIALTIWAFLGKVMSLLFNTLSRFVIAFLPKSKHLLISWLQDFELGPVGRLCDSPSLHLWHVPLDVSLWSSCFFILRYMVSYCF